MQVVRDHLAVDGLDGFRRAGDVAAEGIVREHERVQQEVCELGRRVHHGCQFLDDDVPLLLHLRRVQDGAPHELDEDVQGDLEVRPRDLDVVDGVLAVSSAVHQAANAVYYLRDFLGGRPAFSSLEEQVFDEVGDAGFLVPLVPRAGGHVEGERHRVRMGHRGCKDAEAVRQDVRS